MSTAKIIFDEYGIATILIIGFIIVLTNFIKAPIRKYADKIVAKAQFTRYSIDKSIITSNISIIPLIISFICNLIYYLILLRAKFVEETWRHLFSTTVIDWLLAIGLYETIKLKMNSFTITNQYKESAIKLVKKVNAEEDSLDGAINDEYYKENEDE